MLENDTKYNIFVWLTKNIQHSTAKNDKFMWNFVYEN